MYINNSILQTIYNTNTIRYQIKLIYPKLFYINTETEFDYSNINSYTNLLKIGKSNNNVCKLYLLYLPSTYIIHIQSLVTYLQQFKSIKISKEILLDRIFTDIKTIFSPLRLKIMLSFKGEISYNLELDTDWESMGGSEKYLNINENWNL